MRIVRITHDFDYHAHFLQLVGKMNVYFNFGIMGKFTIDHVLIPLYYIMILPQRR